MIIMLTFVEKIKSQDMNFKLSEEQTQEVLNLYATKTPISKLAKQFECCNTTMSKFLQEHGVIPTKCGYVNARRYPLEKEQEILKLYKSGMSQKDLGIKYNTSNTAIRRVLLRYNVVPRGDGKVNRYCKHNPFKSFKKHDEYSEYFLGLLLTDGCIPKKGKVARVQGINLSLTEADSYIIEAFRDWASPKQKVSYVLQKKYGTYMASISITNEEAVEWLNRKGNFKNKSFSAKIYCPVTWQILRGIFDGDGGWHHTNKDGLNFFVCGLSEAFMNQVNNFLLNQGIRSKIRFAEPDKWHKNGLYYVEVHNYADVMKIGLNMYSNAHIFLKRKYEKWLTFYESKRDKYTLNSGKESHSNPEQNLPTLEVIPKQEEMCRDYNRCS